jgi:hypothetical protein
LANFVGNTSILIAVPIAQTGTYQMSEAISGRTEMQAFPEDALETASGARVHHLHLEGKFSQNAKRRNTFDCVKAKDGVIVILSM